MRITAAIFGCFLALVRGDVVVASEPHQDIYGVWEAPDVGARVRVYACGEALCGELVGLPEGGPTRDVNNPNPDLRQRPLLGLKVLEGFRPVNRGLWIGGGQQGRRPGRLYLPANGDTLGDASNTYEIRLTTRNTIAIGIHDCVLTCRLKSVWTRAE